jgi:hypothetical protein
LKSCDSGHDENGEPKSNAGQFAHVWIYGIFNPKKNDKISTEMPTYIEDIGIACFAHAK